MWGADFNNLSGSLEAAEKNSSGSGDASSSPFSGRGSDGDDESRGKYQMQRRPNRGINSLQMSHGRGARADRIRPGRWVGGEFIGKGSFGQVYKAMNTETGAEFAVKEILIGAVCAHEAGLEALTREIEVMRGLRHTNIVRYLGFEVQCAVDTINASPV